jgi:hypothetical protein
MVAKLTTGSALLVSELTGFVAKEAMKTAGRRTSNRWAGVPRNRAPGAVGQNTSRSIRWAAKQEKVQPLEMCFFLTSPFIELTGSRPPGSDLARSPKCAPVPRMVTTLEITELLDSLGHRRANVRVTLRRSARHSKPHTATHLSWSRLQVTVFHCPACSSLNASRIHGVRFH